MLNKQTKKIIDNIFNSQRVSHCFLINSQRGYDNDKVIIYLLNKINSSSIKSLNNISERYNNIFVIEQNENNNISKNELIEAFDKLNYTSTVKNQEKILVIKNIECASINAINAVLKRIEDPNNKTKIILSTNKFYSVIETVRSRSQIINVKIDSRNNLLEMLRDIDVVKWVAVIYSNIFNDYDVSKKYIDDEWYQLIEEVYENLLKSLDNPSTLYVYLSGMLIKKDVEKNIFILKILIFFISAVANTNITKSSDPLYAKTMNLSNKMRNKGIKLSKFIVIGSEFINKLTSSLSFDIQKEKMLVELMELYDK
ncbi:hypothetical protein MALH07_00571 [Mycoplasma anatis]|uniref:hypothetical protein n=1 Tax=Mycoplasmopsis anatis TaxID=171279 RepID=UPI001C4EAA89|nr:hypothetical protein [Mycoplasmopsis anatis]MBW0599191.1 hypothetical protein [Mycoplasmopsis anatis]MBW0601376.1 hypothetical protein [Mycoplasmopsis anatis]